ncbi:MAG: hypothetical protein AB1505_29410 [Candidatus Latescibacterota bacterium]
MDALSLLLSPAALFAFAGTVSLAIVVRALTGYAQRAAGMRVRLQDAEAELHRLRSALPEQRDRLDQLRQEIQPLKDLEPKMRLYYGRLQGLRADQERRQRERETSGRDAIQIHRPGPPGL